MGRRKLEMKKIENLDSRRVCFTKRRQGLFKKAAKLSKDHNVKILSIVFSSAGKPFVFSSGDPSISFDPMLENFLLLNGSSSSSSYSHPAVENDVEGTLNVEEDEEGEETRVSSLEGISDSTFQFGDEIQQPLSDFEIENPNLLSTNFESGGGFEELTPIDLECSFSPIDLEGSFQFSDIQFLSDFEIENPNFETNGFEEQMSSSFLDVEDYPMEEIWTSLRV